MGGVRMPNYQRIACWGDSQTYGARTYGCYPLHLVKDLNETTRYTWSALNLSTNGHTARDLWFRLATDLSGIQDVHRACILIGANDVANATPVKLFSEYYRQILTTLVLSGVRKIHCGEIPPMNPDGHAFFSRESCDEHATYNAELADVVNQCPSANLVRFPDLDAECFVDPAHFSELGNERVARSYAEAIRRS